MQSPGRVNPTWVEWLMGWPIGHSALEPLATDKFHEWRRPRQDTRNTHGTGCTLSAAIAALLADKGIVPIASGFIAGRAVWKETVGMTRPERQAYLKAAAQKRRATGEDVSVLKKLIRFMPPSSG